MLFGSVSDSRYTGPLYLSPHRRQITKVNHRNYPTLCKCCLIEVNFEWTKKSCWKLMENLVTIEKKRWQKKFHNNILTKFKDSAKRPKVKWWWQKRHKPFRERRLYYKLKKILPKIICDLWLNQYGLFLAEDKVKSFIHCFLLHSPYNERTRFVSCPLLIAYAAYFSGNSWIVCS